MRRYESECLGQFRHRLHEATLPILLLQNKIHCGGNHADSFGCRAGEELRMIETVHDAVDDFVLRKQHVQNFINGNARVAAIGLCVCGQGLLKFGGEAQVIDDQSTRLVFEHAVDASNRLHEIVPAHRLIDVHCVETRCVKASQPHISHDHELEWIFGLLKSLGQFLGRACFERAAAKKLDHSPSRSSRP